MKRALSALVIVLAATTAVTASAADEYNVATGLTAASAPLGFHGVDPVAFVELGNRVEGSAKHTAVHDGVAYYFASSESKEKFERNPTAFLPQNGGFCTFGVSVGKKFDGDPQYADVRNGKLYVFLNEEIFRMYQKDPAGVIDKAAASWQKIRSTKATKL